MEPLSEDVVWIVIVGFILAFLLAFGVGANDVANSFGTSVGSKVLTLRQACILATIFETLGAMMLGYKVSDTVRKGIIDVNIYNNSAKELMLGNMAALGGSAVWNIAATMLKLPISGTHTIVGATIGFTLVAQGSKGVHWKTVGKIVGSWFVSPLMSGVISLSFFFLLKIFILNKEAPLEPGLKMMPFLYGFTLFVNIFSIVHDGPDFLKFNVVPWWGVIILSLGIGITVAVWIHIFFVPVIRRRVQDLGETPESTDELTKDAEAGSVEISYSMTEMPPKESPGNGENFNAVKITEDHNIKKEVEKDKPEVSAIFSSLQVLTATFGSFVHGGNDVSNCIGPLIAIWLIYQDGYAAEKSPTPIYILFYGGVGISIGLWIWGRKVIQTVGSGLTVITPSSGFTIEIGAAFTVLLASKIGLPVSTTHCKVGSVVMVGRARSKESKVDWSLFRNIVLAWIVTLPIAGGISAALMAILRLAVLV